jgi:hypothetical protein
MRYIIFSLIILTSSKVFAQEPDTAFYSVVGNGFIMGVQKSWKENKNEHHIPGLEILLLNKSFKNFSETLRVFAEFVFPLLLCVNSLITH